MARARGEFPAPAWALVLLIVMTVLGSAVAHSTVPEGGCVWTQASEREVMDLLRVVYGEVIEGYVVDSVRLEGFDESPPYCRFRLTLKSERTSAVLELKVFWKFGKFVGFTLYYLPAEPVSTLDLGTPLVNGTAALSGEVLRVIDDLVRRVLSTVEVPDLRGRDLSLSGAVHGGELVLSERPFGDQEGTPFRDFAATVDLGGGVVARVLYRWDEQGHQDITIEYYRVYDIGLNMTTKYRLLFVSLTKAGPGQGWVVYSIIFVPYPVRFMKVEVLPEAYVRNAEEAVVEELGGSCRVINSSYERIEYMLPPEEMNGSIYFGRPTYIYHVTVDCGKGLQEYEVLVNATDGKAFHISPTGGRNALLGDIEVGTDTPTMYEVRVPAAAAAVAAIALLIYWRRGKGGH